MQNVKVLCKARGVSPTVACKESGAGKSLLSQIEKHGITPSVKKIQQLADYLGVTTSDLLGEKNSPTTVSDDEAALDQELISRLVELTPEELEKVDAFVQGLLASR